VVAIPSTTVIAAAPTCLSSKLVLAQGENYSAHAENDVVFTLTNESPVACRLSGYPGVSFLDGAGVQVGADATRYPSAESVVTLASGAMAEFQEVDPQAACAAAPRAPQMRVFPPNQTAALTIAVQLFVCHPSVTAVSAFNPNRMPLIN